MSQVDPFVSKFLKQNMIYHLLATLDFIKPWNLFLVNLVAANVETN